MLTNYYSTEKVSVFKSKRKACINNPCQLGQGLTLYFLPSPKKTAHIFWDNCWQPLPIIAYQQNNDPLLRFLDAENILCCTPALLQEASAGHPQLPQPPGHMLKVFGVFLFVLRLTKQVREQYTSDGVDYDRPTISDWTST